MSEIKQTTQEEIKDILFFENYDDRLKQAYSSIHNTVQSVGWKDFVFAVLQYQLRMVKSNYRLLKSWK